MASSVSPSVFFVDKVEANERRARERERDTEGRAIVNRRVGIGASSDGVRVTS